MPIILQQPQAGRIESMKVSQLLENALALFGTNGELWLSHSRPAPNCAPGESVCVHTAIARVDIYNSYRLVRTLGFSELEDAWDWNDDPRRTWPEVRDKFQKAIALARQEESA